MKPTGNKTEQNPINSYSEFLELKDGTKIEIRAESFEDPIFTAGEVVRSQVLTINARTKGLISVGYSVPALTDYELKNNVKQLKKANSKALNINELYKLYGQ